MKCPNCRLENPPNAQRCDCGYDFTSNKVRESYVKESTKKPSIYVWIFTVFLTISGGLFGILISYSIAYGKSNDYGFRYAIPSRNIGKIFLGISVFSTILWTILKIKHLT